MLICFYGSRESEEKITSIISEVGASELLALPNDKLEDTLSSLFSEDKIVYDVYGISSWIRRAEKAVQKLKEKNGIMVIFPESDKTLSTHEDYLATLCKRENVRLILR